MTRILLVAGDPSGDLYGSMLIEALRRARPALRIDAAGGPLMKRVMNPGDAFLFDLASMGMTGFVEPIRGIPTLMRLLSDIRKRLNGSRPDALVCIDYYGFNRRVLSAAKKAGVPAFYFVSPQVWATRPGRIRYLRENIRRMLCIFPFEEKLYREAGVPVTWVGHPLLDRLPEPKRSGAAPKKETPLRLGLLPGSRRSEVRYHLPLFLESTSRILRDFPRTEVTIFAAPNLSDEFYNGWLENWRPAANGRIRLVRDKNYEERARQDFVLTSSGTATVENALLGLPMVVIYKTFWPTYLIAMAMVRVPYFAMPNLLAGRKLVPEFLQGDATVKNISDSALELLGRPKRLAKLRKELLELRATLGGRGAADRAADEILGELAGRSENTLLKS